VGTERFVEDKRRNWICLGHLYLGNASAETKRVEKWPANSGRI
jgi:hypothetical protein